MKTVEEIEQEIAALKADQESERQRAQSVYEFGEKIRDLENERMSITHPELYAEWQQVNNEGLELCQRSYAVAQKIRDAGLRFKPFDWK